MSELRIYLRRDSLLEEVDCAWALLDDAGHLLDSGNRLGEPPKARLCRLVLASDLVLSIRTTLPDLPERRLAPLLAAAAESLTLVEADDLHAVLMERSADGDATLAVVEAAWFGRVLTRLGAKGLQPDAALPEYLLLPWAKGSWSVGWQDRLARFDQALGMALDDAEPPVGLSLALGQRGRPESIRIYQDGVLDRDRWQAALGTPVESAGPWDWRTAAWPELPSLLQGRHAPTRNRLDWKRLLPLAWGALALVAIQFAALTLDWAMLAHESAALKREALVLAQRSLPAHAAIVDPAWQVTQRLQQLQTATGTPSPNACVGLLGRLSQVWPAGIRAQDLSYEGGTISVSLASVDAGWLDQLKSAAALRGLAIASVQDGKEIRLSVKPTGSTKKDMHHDE